MFIINVYEFGIVDCCKNEQDPDRGVRLEYDMRSGSDAHNIQSNCRRKIQLAQYDIVGFYLLCMPYG